MASIHSYFLAFFLLFSFAPLLICDPASLCEAENCDGSLKDKRQHYPDWTGAAQEFIITVAHDRDSPRDAITVRASELLHNSTDLGTFFSDRLARVGEHWFNVVEADEVVSSTPEYLAYCFDDFDHLHSVLTDDWLEPCRKWGDFTDEVTTEFLPLVEDRMQCHSRGGNLYCPKSGFYVRYKDGLHHDGGLGALLHTDGGDGYYDLDGWPQIREYYYSDVPGGEWITIWAQLYGDAGRQMLFIDPNSIKQRQLPDGPPHLTPYPGREGNATDWRFLLRSDLRAGVGFAWNTLLVPHANAVPANAEARGRLQPTLTADIRCTCTHPDILEVLGPGPRLEHSAM